MYRRWAKVLCPLLSFCMLALHCVSQLFPSVAHQLALCMCNLFPKAGSPVIAHSFVVLVTVSEARAMHIVLAFVEPEENKDTA